MCDRLSARQRLAACSWPTTISTLAASPSNKEALRSRITLAPMSSTRVPGGVVHKMPADLRGNPTVEVDVTLEDGVR